MKLLFLITLLSTLLFSANESFSKENEINITELLRSTADYLDDFSAKDLNITSITNKLNSITDDTLQKLSAKLSYFNVEKVQSVTYEVKVTTKKGIEASVTAVALTSYGTLVTAYHNVEAYKKITVVDYQGKKYSATIGKISAENDLAYLHIKAKNIPFTTLANHTLLGEEIYLLSYESLLLEGIVSQIKPNNIIINIEAKKGTSGGGVFNNSNELVSILIRKDIVDKTSSSVRHNAFHSIVENFQYKDEMKNPYGNDYDNSYCYNEDDLKIWNQYAKSYDFRTQEMHALFIGLCKKMKNKDLTTEQAEFIFESSRVRLFGK
ncbi:MAG: hypothetical protein ACI9TV_002812 [Sulfurimonas sp.]|jgi:hypothetical protein|uniref:S1 family peptidase n=1 Tax=Sulfurimonas sp. TaxID=2022749 RepID=UPI0039E33E3D